MTTDKRPKATKCKSCEAPIFWATTAQGKKIPVDEAPSPQGNVVLTMSGGELRATVFKDAQAALARSPKGCVLRTAHHSTCPDADKHRAAKPAPRDEASKPAPRFKRGPEEQEASATAPAAPGSLELDGAAIMMILAPDRSLFGYAHLPDHLQAISRPFADLALELFKILPDGTEKALALRKILEAKDCAVRAALQK